MTTTTLPLKIPNLFLIEQINIVTILVITLSIFAVLLILGVRKSYKLKAENEKLSKKSSTNSKEDNKTYKDFTEGHLYD
jgi:cell division protein FtsL